MAGFFFLCVWSAIVPCLSNDIVTVVLQSLSCVRPKPQYACHSGPLAGHITGWCTFSDMLLLWMFHLYVKLSSDNVKEETECCENYRDLKSFREVKKISIQFSWGGFSSSAFCLSNGGQHGQQTGGCPVLSAVLSSGRQLWWRPQCREQSVPASLLLLIGMGWLTYLLSPSASSLLEKWPWHIYLEGLSERFGMIK